MQYTGGKRYPIKRTLGTHEEANRNAVVHEKYSTKTFVGTYVHRTRKFFFSVASPQNSHSSMYISQYWEDKTRRATVLYPKSILNEGKCKVSCLEM